MSKIAAVQMASGPSTSSNLIEAERLISIAASDGASVIVLPENFSCMPQRPMDLINDREAADDGPAQNFLSRQSERHGVWIVGGTIPVLGPDRTRSRAACIVYNERGERVARYDKMHMFDVHVVGSEETYQESDTIEPGDKLVVIDSPIGRLGLAICYDLRFPEMMRALMNQKAQVIAIPSAFTAVTGRVHWQPLLQARAIENLCYIVASAQGGFHPSGRETWGRTMILDHWGSVLTCLERGSGAVVADLNLNRQERVRKTFPVLKHQRIHCKLENPA